MSNETLSNARETVGSTVTAKHIREALKEVFPGIKFSVKSTSYESLFVQWEDGPLGPDVKKVINRFSSYTRVLSRSDYDRVTPYEWKGVLYVGPQYLSFKRNLSEEHKKVLIVAWESQGKSYRDIKPYELVELERQLIGMHQLPSIAPRNLPDLLRDDIEPIDERPKKSEEAKSGEFVKGPYKDNVVFFPERR